mgnify:CR=1 FL=1
MLTKSPVSTKFRLMQRFLYWISLVKCSSSPRLLTSGKKSNRNLEIIELLPTPFEPSNRSFICVASSKSCLTLDSLRVRVTLRSWIVGSISENLVLLFIMHVTLFSSWLKLIDFKRLKYICQLAIEELAVN